MKLIEDKKIMNGFDHTAYIGSAYRNNYFIYAAK